MFTIINVLSNFSLFCCFLLFYGKMKPTLSEWRGVGGVLLYKKIHGQ